MGAWGEGLLENDAALDILYLWDEWVGKRSLGIEDATERALKHWGVSLKYGDSITNCEVIAWAAKCLEEGVIPPKRLAKAAIDATNRELVSAELERWSRPDARELELKSLLSALGGEIKPPKPTRFFKHKALHFRNSEVAVKALRKLRGNQYAFSSSKLPPFITSLNRLMFSHVWEENQNVTVQAMAERNMMLLWYLSFSLDLSAEEFDKLMHRIVEKHR